MIADGSARGVSRSNGVQSRWIRLSPRRAQPLDGSFDGVPLPIGTVKPVPRANTPAGGKLAVERFQPAVSAPVHSRRLRREGVIEAEEPGDLAATFLKTFTNAPADATDPQHAVLVLALITRAPA